MKGCTMELLTGVFANNVCVDALHLELSDLIRVVL
jgi:hypothetical protein